jgi:hypothetical protein
MLLAECAPRRLISYILRNFFSFSPQGLLALHVKLLSKLFAAFGFFCLKRGGRFLMSRPHHTIFLRELLVQEQKRISVKSDSGDLAGPAWLIQAQSFWA